MSGKKPQPQRREDIMVKTLGVTPAQLAAQPQIQPILRRAKISAVKAADYLRMSEDPDARRFLAILDGLGAEARRLLPLEAIAIAAGISTKRLFELISGEVFVQARFESALLAAASHPTIVAKSIERALEEPLAIPQPDGTTKIERAPDGVTDRKMLHQQAGFLPMPKTQIVSLPGVKMIDARQQTATVTVLPPVESNVHQMADRFGTKLLGSGPEPVEIAEGDELEGAEEDESAD